MCSRARTTRETLRPPAKLWRYPDGWAIWAIHGVRVPQRVVTNPRGLSIEERSSCSLADIRRAASFAAVAAEQPCRCDTLPRADWSLRGSLSGVAIGLWNRRESLQCAMLAVARLCTAACVRHKQKRASAQLMVFRAAFRTNPGGRVPVMMIQDPHGYLPDQ